jgi:ribonuclease HI
LPPYPYALAAGFPEIHLFGDGSFQQLLETGTWAFSAPALGLQQVGLEVGPSVEHFEIRAALSGIEKVLEVDRTRRPLRVYGDSEIALQFLQHAAKREILPCRKSFHRVRGLYDLAISLVTQRPVMPVKVNSARPEHAVCHRLAAKRMREELATDPALAWRLVFRREEERMKALIKERTALQLRLEALEEEVLLIGTRMRALHQGRPEGVSVQEGMGRLLGLSP